MTQESKRLKRSSSRYHYGGGTSRAANTTTCLEQFGGETRPSFSSDDDPFVRAVVKMVMKELLTGCGRPLIQTMIREAMMLDSTSSCHCLTSRSIINDQVPVLHPSPYSRAIQIPKFHLRFVSKLPKHLYTLNPIKDEGGRPLEVELLDSNSNRVTETGPIIVEIQMVVLPGDVEPKLITSTTEDHKFNDTSIVYSREGKGPLLDGKCSVVKVQNGVACFEGLRFTDNASWTRSKTFKLGARAQVHVVEETTPSQISMITITDAVSDNAFKVKDRRGEAYEKHEIPTLEDELYRLKGIAKEGPYHKALLSFGISKVKDFLRLYHVDQYSLRKILSKFSNRQWEAIIEQANLCKLSTTQRYTCYSLQERIGLVLNCVFEIEKVEMLFNGTGVPVIYHSLETLNDNQKSRVNAVRNWAYVNQLIVPITTDIQQPPASVGGGVNVTLLQSDPPNIALQYMTSNTHDEYIGAGDAQLHDLIASTQSYDMGAAAICSQQFSDPVQGFQNPYQNY